MKRRNFLLLPLAPFIAKLFIKKKPEIIDFKFHKGPVYKFASKEALDRLPDYFVCSGSFAKKLLEMAKHESPLIK